MLIKFELKFDDVCDLVEKTVESFGFTAGSLGKDLADSDAVAIAARSNQGLDADGQPFAPNAPEYAAYKLKRYSVDRPGELEGQMLSLESIKGEVTVTDDAIVMKYGTGRPSRGIARNGAPIASSSATDREKAAWFAEGGREFFGFDDDMVERNTQTVEDAWAAHVKASGL